MKDNGTLHDADVLHWFAGVFLNEVTEDQFKAYQSGAAAPFLAHISEQCDISALEESFDSCLSNLAGQPNPVRLLAADFAALFLLGEQNNAQPYAGLYSGTGGNVFGETHDKMLKRLQALGLDRAGHSNEPADHISYQLEYLSLLLAWPEGDETPEDWPVFVQEEMLNWIDRWSVAVEHAPAKSDFYATLSHVLHAYLRQLSNRV